MIPGITEKLLRDERELRAFYESVGLSPAVIERAIAAKFSPPASEEEAPPLRKKRGRVPRRPSTST
jgi:hypothetical protein